MPSIVRKSPKNNNTTTHNAQTLNYTLNTISEEKEKKEKQLKSLKKKNHTKLKQSVINKKKLNNQNLPITQSCKKLPQAASYTQSNHLHFPCNTPNPRTLIKHYFTHPSASLNCCFLFPKDDHKYNFKKKRKKSYIFFCCCP